MKNKLGATISIVLTFIVIFAIMAVAYIYLMQKTWLIYRRTAYLKKDIVLSAIDLAVYDISKGRHLGSANYNPLFYAQTWTSCGPDCYSVVYKIPKKVVPTGSISCSSSKVKLDGSDCFVLDSSSVVDTVNVEVKYEKSGTGNWQILVEEPRI